jgi:thymidylate synthase ThyX
MKKILFGTTKNCWVLEGTQMEVEVILASKCSTVDFHPNAYRLPPPLYTVRMRYPRIIHAEVMTHRVFGRNARSSRAVPVRTMLGETVNTPYVPWHWLKNKPGMQGTEPLTPEEEEEAIKIWLTARDCSLKAAEQLFDPDGLNIHKQNPNRLLEPFMYIDVLITATEWENFLWLRDHKDAEPHLQDLARMTRQALAEAEFQHLKPGEWHLPYIEEYEWQDAFSYLDQQESSLGPADQEMIATFLRKISAARCARISYAPFDGDASYERELERYNLLVSSERVHASPLEHQAAPDRGVIVSSDIFYQAEGDLTPDRTFDARDGWENEHLHGNLTGWIQARKLVPNEAVTA